MKFEEFRKKNETEAIIKEGRYVVGKMNLPPRISDKIFAVIKNDNETTLIAEEGHGLDVIEEEKFFKIISFSTKLPFDLVGFLAFIAKILADQSISIFVVSAYSTDHILIKENDIGKALKIFEDNGIKITS